MIILQIIMFWFLLGIAGWYIGTMSDRIFRKSQRVVSIFGCILLGPIILYVAGRCLLREIFGWMHERK